LSLEEELTDLHYLQEVKASSTSNVKMGKVHGSLARAGKVKSATPKARLS